MAETATAALLTANVGEAVLVPAAVAAEATSATGQFGLSLGATIGIAFLGFVAIGGLSYYIYRKVKKTETNGTVTNSRPPA